MQTAISILRPQNEALIKQMNPVVPVKRVKRFVVKHEGERHLYRDDDIIHCLAESNYCSIYYGTGLRVILAKTLKAISDMLPPTGFVRVHRSHIIRRDAIQLVQPKHIVLSNGEVVPVSRRYQKKVILELADTQSYC